ncbi:MAG: universal stress protein [Deltaproteobacteria bacterium]|nr:universal stress protein [Deltaproteobacteria bacterium]
MALNFKRILCPVDLSRFSRYALRLAANIAENSNSTLYILHVIQNPFDELYMTPITQADPGAAGLYRDEASRRAELLQATVEHSEALLKQFCHDWVEQLPKTRYIVESGDPFEKILDLAETHKIDLIVLATHGRTGLKRLIIGNVAEKVVRHAPCPVLTVKGRAGRKRS